MPLPPPPPPRASANANASASAKLSVFGTPWPLPPEKLRVRLKYVTARFLQMPEPRILLRSGEDILRWVQQLEDEERFTQARELVRLALEEEPKQRALWLYLFHSVVRAEDAATFTHLARLFSALYPDDAVLEDVAYVAGVLPRDAKAAAAIRAVSTWSIHALTERNVRAQTRLHDALVAEAATAFRTY
jgi:hypothetical protein